MALAASAPRTQQATTNAVVTRRSLWRRLCLGTPPAKEVRPVEVVPHVPNLLTSGNQKVNDLPTRKGLMDALDIQAIRVSSTRGAGS